MSTTTVMTKMKMKMKMKKFNARALRPNGPKLLAFLFSLNTRADATSSSRDWHYMN